MIYIFESELPNNKSIVYSLLSVYGIGKNSANLICKKLGFSANFKIKNISKEQTSKLIRVIESLKLSVGSDLRKSRSLINKKLVSIKSYRGLRKYKGLPVRGQRTHTNAKTASKQNKKI